VQRLAADGATEELAQALGRAARCLVDRSSPEASERARSAAEQFLFERLESLPQTAGKFILNGTLDFRFGNRPAEVDLLARELRLALEVDGYFHFVTADGYRRDRRKDWELQRRGFLVLRFLAEDVVVRLEEVLDTILTAVDERQRQQPVKEPEP
jgi:very-short-patch-repair endonuclease